MKLFAWMSLSCVILCLFNEVRSEECHVIDGNPCMCQLSDGRKLDIRPLNSVNSFKDFIGPDHNFRYGWGPCNHSMDKTIGYCNPGNDAAVCQAGTSPTDSWFNLGKLSTAVFDVDTTAQPSVTTLNYTGGTPAGNVPRQSFFQLHCDPNADPGTIREFEKEGQGLNYFFVVTSKHACLTSSESCTVVNPDHPCACQLTDRRFINLTRIQHSFENFLGDDGRSYAWGPCGKSLNKGDDCVLENDPAMCQGDGGHWYSLGMSSTASFSVDLENLPVTTTLTYTGGSAGRSTVVKMVCDETAGAGKITELYETPQLQYNFVFSSLYACPSME